MMRSLCFSLILLASVSAAPPKAAAQEAHPLLHAVFQDHAVLQRGAPIRVWGTAPPGETVVAELNGAFAEAMSGADGRWSAVLPAMSAGGPYTLEARASGGARQAASDVLVGDVFLCSGQSNMALPVSRSLDAEAEIRGAAHDRIRMLTVGLASSPAPLAAFPEAVAWERATPETVAGWSAVCYFFARELQRSVDVPLGLIHSSWGGSDIRAWMNAEALRGVGGYAEALSLLRLYAGDPRAAQRALGAEWETWWRGRSGDARGAEPWQPQTGAAWPLAPPGLGDWNTWEGSGLRGFTGMVWFRARFELTEAQAAQDAVLSLGGIDEVDQTWINGRVVGNTFGWGTERHYEIPAEMLREGENVVVVNVLNTYGAGGMTGDSARRALVLAGGERVPLDAWRYRKAPAEVGHPPRAPWESVGGRTTLHNAMVAPLGGYGLRGAVWYQGESNTDEGEAYEGLLRALMAQWRAQFGADLPVLVVQLANYGRQPAEPVESGWAEVREAQRRATLDDPRAAFVVTIDVGDPHDIHPQNKQEVGRRLARAARHAVYGEAVAPSGPVPAGAVREGEAVVVTFDDVEGGLVARGDGEVVGFELCGDAPGSCRYAEARIEGRRVVLHAERPEEVARVRYCWADSPTCTLYDASGLPAGPFELALPE